MSIENEASPPHSGRLRVGTILIWLSALAALACFVFVMIPLISDLRAHHRVGAAVESVGGSVSAMPGIGYHDIHLDAYYCGTLDEADLLRVVRIQRLNRPLIYLSLNEQHISSQLAIIIAGLEFEGLSIVNSTLPDEAIAAILTSKHLTHIYCDQANADRLTTMNNSRQVRVVTLRAEEVDLLRDR